MVKQGKISAKKLCDCARCFCVMGDETRMKILAFLLKRQQASVSEIAKSLGLSLSTSSHSLAKLLNQNLVKRQKRARRVFYSPTNSPMVKITRRALGI